MTVTTTVSDFVACPLPSEHFLIELSFEFTKQYDVGLDHFFGWCSIIGRPVISMFLLRCYYYVYTYTFACMCKLVMITLSLLVGKCIYSS